MDTLKTFDEAFKQLSILEGFDSEAFISDKKDEQSVCNFILSLSLIHNDIKNIDLTIGILKHSKPSGNFEPRPDWGEYNGISVFFNRVRISIINELMNKISDCKQDLQHPLFLETLKKISKKSREAWTLLVSAANTTSALPKIKNPYFMIRNKTSSHYDNGQILKGYRNFFENKVPKMLPMISRGNQMVSSRFYFADAAAEECLNLALEKIPLNDFLFELSNNLINLNQSLHDIVLKFIIIRKPGWKRI